MEAAIAYIRVSDTRQVIDGNSLATQEKQVQMFARARNYHLERLFVEPGESAKTDDRPILQEMLQYCTEQKGKIQALIVPKIDRLARNAYDYAGLKIQLSELGIRLESVGERIENNPVGRFTESILASVAQFDNEIRAERCRGGMIQAVSEGRWVFVAPFGYRNVRYNGRATIEPDPKTADVVVGIFNRVAAGSTPKDVLKWLNEENFEIGRSLLFRLIRNPIYTGVISAFGETHVAAPPFLPLISRALFLEVQALSAARNCPRPYDRENPDFPLRGTLKCECGQFLTANWSQGRSRKYAHYRCKACPRVNVRREHAHATFCKELRDLVPNPKHTARLYRRVLEASDADERHANISRRRLESQIASNLLLCKSIARKNAFGVIPDDVAKEQIQELNVELAELKRMRDVVSQPTDNLQDVARFARNFFDDLDEKWREAGVANKKRLQRYVFPNGMTIAPDGQSRTAKSERLTGLEELLCPKMSHVVDHETENPILVRQKKRGRDDDDIVRLRAFIVKLYQTFKDWI